MSRNKKKMRWLTSTMLAWFLVISAVCSLQVAGAEVANSRRQVQKGDARSVIFTTGARVPESYDPALRGPTLPPCLVPEDITHPSCTPFQICPFTNRIATQYKGSGVIFNPAVGVFDDPPEHWAGVNPANIMDIVTAVEGTITLPGSTVVSAVDYLAVSGGLVAAPADILLEVFDSNGTLIDSSIGDDGFDVDGRHLAIIDHTGTADITSFRVSTPTADSFGVRRICFEEPEVFMPPSPDPCIVDVQVGVVHLPPKGCPYLSPSQVHAVIDTLPITAEIEMAAIHTDFICRTDPTSDDCGDGDPTDGDTEEFDSVLVLEFQGTGDLSDFHRVLVLDAVVKTETGPRDPSAPLEGLATDMRSIQASLVGDPDFDMLQITAGTDNGFPSPGELSLFDNGDGTFGVESDFEINFEIQIQGAVGGSLEGISGTFPGTVTVGVKAAPFFRDGFESGDTTRWSTAVP